MLLVIYAIMQRERVSTTHGRYLEEEEQQPGDDVRSVGSRRCGLVAAPLVEKDIEILTLDVFGWLRGQDSWIMTESQLHRVYQREGRGGGKMPRI